MLSHRLHIPVEIDYVGAHRTHPRYPDEWIVSARILSPDYEYGGMVETSVHYAMAARATFVARISDARSPALSILCYQGGADLDDTVWRHFPRHDEGEVRSVIAGYKTS